jgi:hypothetical protein
MPVEIEIEPHCLVDNRFFEDTLSETIRFLLRASIAGFHPPPPKIAPSGDPGLNGPLVQFYLDGQVPTIYSPAHA